MQESLRDIYSTIQGSYSVIVKLIINWRLVFDSEVAQTREEFGDWLFLVFAVQY